MAKTFNELWNELKGDLPAVSHFRCKDWVQRAWRDIRDTRRWSFLVSEGVLIVPAPISAGTVTTTQYSTSVVGDAAAQAAWAAAILPLSGIDITDRQFRFAGDPIYNITAYDPATITLTLDRPYQEASSVSASGYQIYRCYFEAPAADFLRWVSVIDPVNGYRIRKRNLHWQRADADRRDPRRQAVSLPIAMVNYKSSSAGVPIFEMWPHPLTAMSYTAFYSRRGTDLAAGESLPAGVPDELVMSGARLLAYLWCAANAGRFEELGGTNWFYLRSAEQKSYDKLLASAKKNDEEISLTNWSENEDDPQLSGPLDANYLQAHDVWLD